MDFLLSFVVIVSYRTVLLGVLLFILMELFFCRHDQESFVQCLQIQLVIAHGQIFFKFPFDPLQRVVDGLGAAPHFPGNFLI